MARGAKRGRTMRGSASMPSARSLPLDPACATCTAVWKTGACALDVGTRTSLTTHASGTAACPIALCTDAFTRAMSCRKVGAPAQYPDSARRWMASSLLVCLQSW